MYSRLYLKEKNDEHAIYCYSVDKIGAPSDGEIEFIIKTNERKLLKTATGDDDGGHARWLVFEHMRRIVLKEGCPEKYFLAIG